MTPPGFGTLATSVGCDPSGAADCLADINVALAALTGTGGAFLFPAGTFKVSAPITNPGNVPIVLEAGAAFTGAGAASVTTGAYTWPNRGTPFTYVFQPAGTPGGNVYTDWASLYAVLSTVQGPAIIEVDSSAATAHMTPGGPYNLHEVTFVPAPFALRARGDGILTIDDGATITPGNLHILDGLTVEYLGAPGHVCMTGGTSPGGIVPTIEIGFGAVLLCTASGSGGTGGFLAVPGGIGAGAANVYLHDGSQLGDGINAVVLASHPGDGGCQVFASSFSIVEANSIIVTGSRAPGGAALTYDDTVTVGSPIGVTLILGSQAALDAYTPAVPANWSPPPTEVAAALDQLAANIPLASVAQLVRARSKLAAGNPLATDPLLTTVVTAPQVSVAVGQSAVVTACAEYDAGTGNGITQLVRHQIQDATPTAYDSVLQGMGSTAANNGATSNANVSRTRALACPVDIAPGNYVFSLVASQSNAGTPKITAPAGANIVVEVIQGGVPFFVPVDQFLNAATRRIWVADSNVAALPSFDTLTRAPALVVDLASIGWGANTGALRIVGDATNLYVSSNNASTNFNILAIINQTTGAIVGLCDVGAGAEGVLDQAVHGDNLYVVDDSDKVNRFSIAAAIAAYPAPVTPVVEGPATDAFNCVAFDPVTGNVFAGTSGAGGGVDTLYEMDPLTLAPTTGQVFTRSVGVLGFQRLIAAAGSIWASTAKAFMGEAGNLLRIDPTAFPAGGSVVGIATTSVTSFGLSWDAASTSILVGDTDLAAPQVSRVSTGTNTQVSAIVPAGGQALNSAVIAGSAIWITDAPPSGAGVLLYTTPIGMEAFIREIESF